MKTHGIESSDEEMNEYAKPPNRSLVVAYVKKQFHRGRGVGATKAYKTHL